MLLVFLTCVASGYVHVRVGDELPYGTEVFEASASGDKLPLLGASFCVLVMELFQILGWIQRR